MTEGERSWDNEENNTRSPNVKNFDELALHVVPATPPQNPARKSATALEEETPSKTPAHALG
jgi:hypothetical protein